MDTPDPPVAPPRLRIGELARRTGVREHLLRYYEAQGLLSPSRSAGGYREYTEADVAVVRRIRTLLAAGLTTRTIAQALPCLGDEDDRLVPCDGQVRDLRGERARIDNQIEQLEASRQMLEDIIAARPIEACRAPSPGVVGPEGVVVTGSGAAP